MCTYKNNNKMTYNIEPSDRIYNKGYGFLSFSKIYRQHYQQKNE